MKNPEQLYFDNWKGDDPEEPPKVEAQKFETDFRSKKILEKDDEECKVCGDSGPCSVCERGRNLAKELGKPYRNKKR